MTALYRLLAIALLADGLTYAAVRASGFHPDPPWGLVLLVALKCFPFALILASVDDHRPSSAVSLLLAACVIWTNLETFGWLFLLIPALVTRSLSASFWTKRVALAAVILILGYHTVWNGNYLLLHWNRTRSFADPLLRDFDLWFYGWQHYQAVFPLIDAPLGRTFFQLCYGMLFNEIVLLLVLKASQGEQAVAGFLRSLFGYYALGFALFLAWPSVGPPLYFPESVRLASLAPSEAALFKAMLADYRAVLAGPGPLPGIGYFIAFPSLHVIVAIYLQYQLAPWTWLSRTFLAVNASIVLSTVVMGYHYLLDLLVPVLAVAAWELWRRRRRLRPASA